MKKLILVLPICLLFTGCASLFKSERVALPPPPPRIEADDREVLKQQAKINNELARWIKENGVQPNSEKAILLEDGTKVFLRWVGEPREKVEVNNSKGIKNTVEDASNIVNDFNEKSEEYTDEMAEFREDKIEKVNLKWDFFKIFRFFGGSTVFLVIASIVLPIFFPVILPLVQIFWQLLRGGISAFGIFAKLGLSGVKNIVGAVESFREKYKGTEVKKVFDEHMSKELDSKDKVSLDKFKNHFDI
jgi:hypothetical protein